MCSCYQMLSDFIIALQVMGHRKLNKIGFWEKFKCLRIWVNSWKVLSLLQKVQGIFWFYF